MEQAVAPHRGAARRLCRWCEGPIRPGSRRDAKFCCQSHRQAAHRFVRSAGATAPTGADPSLLATRDASVLQPRRFAYADPPYPGLARRYYADQPDYGGEVDHRELVSRLASSFDGWALSTSTAALRDVLLLCPADVRVAAWFRGARPGRSYSPLSAWEPVIYAGARRVVSGGRPTRQICRPSTDDASSQSPSETTAGLRSCTTAGPTSDATDPSRLDRGTTDRQDALVYVQRPRLTDPRRVIGAKPAAFSAWLFALLGIQPGDELVDLFPGSGGVSRAFEAFVDASSWDPQRDASRRPGRRLIF